MLTAMLRSHMMLIRVAADRLGGEAFRGKGWDKISPFEIPTSCCDIWLSNATVWSPESTESRLYPSMTNAATVAENRPVCRKQSTQNDEQAGGGPQTRGRRWYLRSNARLSLCRTSRTQREKGSTSAWTSLRRFRLGE
jgi:hypothetical protein